MGLKTDFLSYLGEMTKPVLSKFRYKKTSAFSSVDDASANKSVKTNGMIQPFVQNNKKKIVFGSRLPRAMKYLLAVRVDHDF